MLNVGHVVRKSLAAFAALATVLGLTAGAVALAAPAAATGGVSRIQVTGLNANIDVSNPDPSTTYRNFTDARKSAVPMTVTFTGSASFTVDGGTSTVLTSGSAVNVPIHTGITAIAITHNDGSSDTVYNVEIKRAWLISGYEVYDGATDMLLLSRHVSDGNFDPLSRSAVNLSIPHSVATLKWKMFYDTPAEPTASSRSAWVGGAIVCSGYECQSGELSEAHPVPTGTATYPVITQVDNGSGFDGYTWTQWEVTITRAPAYGSSTLASVTVPGSTFTEVQRLPYTFRTFIDADKQSMPLTATFASGTAFYSVNGGASSAMTSGVAVSIPLTSGLNAVSITHVAPSGAQTVYTYRLIRPHPITGFEVADAATGEILWSKTGADFDVTNHQYYLDIPNSISQIKIRSFYEPFPAGYISNSWIHSYGYCPDQCESGEWSNPLNMNVGVNNGGPLMMCAIPDVCGGGVNNDWSYWMIQITRASVTADISGVSISGAPQAGQVLTVSPSGVGGYPAPTVSYQWQSATSESGPWNDVDGFTAPRFVLKRSHVALFLRVRATSANGGVSTPTTVYSSPTAAISNTSVAAPTGLRAVPGDGTLLVSWVAPIDADYASGTVTATAGGQTFTCTDVDYDCAVEGLTNGVEYSVTAIATAGTGNGSIDSSPSSAITATPAVPTAPALAGAVITGTATVGQRLTAGAEGASGTPGPTLTYLWQKSNDGLGGWSAISGATHSSLTLSSALVNKHVRVRITATTGVSPAVSVTSEAAGPIAAATDIMPDRVLDTPNSMSSYPQDVAFDSQGYMYVITGFGSGQDALMKYAPGASEYDAPLAIWTRGEDGSSFVGAGVTVDSNDNVWIADFNHRVWMLPAGSRVSDPLMLRLDSTSLYQPMDVAVDANGYLYASEYYRNQIQVYAPGFILGERPVRTIPTVTQAGKMALDANGNIVIATESALRVFSPGGAGVSNTPLQVINRPTNCNLNSVAVDGEGRIWASSAGCSRVFVYNPNAVDDLAPVTFVPVNYSTGLGTNPVDGNVRAATNYYRQVVSWDRSLLSLGALPTAGEPRVATVNVAVNEQVAVRGELTGTFSGLTGMPAPSLTKKWQRADSAAGPWTDIPGGATANLLIGPELQGAYLRFAVSVENSFGTTTTVSETLGPVAARPAHAINQWITGQDLADIHFVGASDPYISDMEFLSDGRIIAVSQYARRNRVVAFAANANGNAAPVQSIVPGWEGDLKQGTGLSIAKDGNIWTSYSGDLVTKLDQTSDGVVTPMTTFEGSKVSGAMHAIEDANGYLYVASRVSGIEVFAPGASGSDDPIRTIPVRSSRLALDIDGNLLAVSEGYLHVFESGASTNTDPLASLALGGYAVDMETDRDHRIWVLINDQVKIFNPRIGSDSVPVVTVVNDWTTKMSGARAMAVSATTEGLVAIAANASIQTYDWSSLLLPVPGSAVAPTITGVTIWGDARVAGLMESSRGTVAGFPDPRNSYQWQRSKSGTEWTSIAGATGYQYFPVAGDAGYRLRVRVTASNSMGSDSTFSDPTDQLGYGYVRSPIESLRGTSTRMNGSWIVRTTSSGSRLVVNHQGMVQEFAPGATHNASPTRRIFVRGYSYPSGLTVAADDSLWLSYEGASLVAHLAADANGGVTPLQSFNPQCWRPGSVAVDAQGLIYVPCGDGAIKVFASDATGTPNPVRTITGQSTVREVTFDPAGNLAVPGANFFRTFALGGEGTSNNPIVDKSLNFSARSVAWDTHGNIIFSESGGIHAYDADLADTSSAVAEFSSDGWTSTSDIYGILYDATQDRLQIASYNVGVTTHDWAEILVGDPDTPSPVTNLRATPGIHAMTIEWDASAGEVTQYVVTVSGGSEPIVCTTVETRCVLGWNDGVRGETNYSVNVQTIRRSASATSDSISVTPEVDPNTKPPKKVTNVDALGLNGVISVSWKAPSGVITGYTVTARSGDVTLTCEPDEATDTSCDISEAVNGVTYIVRVVAHRFEMNSPGSDPIEVTVERREAPTVTPLTVTGIARSAETLRLEEPDVTGYPTPTVTYQWQSAASETGPWTEILDGDGLAHRLRKPDVGRYVRILVVVDNEVGEPLRRYSRIFGPVLNVAGTTESLGRPITGMRGEFGDGKVTLSWDRVKGVTADSYTVSIVSGGITRTVTVDDTALTKVITGLTNGTTYRFSVVATGHPETQSRRVEVMPVGALGKVAKVTATVRGTTVNLVWTRPAGTSPVATYRVVLDSATKGAPDRELVVKGTKASIEKLVKGATYKVSIIGRNVVGVGATYVLPGAVQVK